MTLGERYLQERERSGTPTDIIIDIDSTDDLTHGQQEGTALHAYYGRYMYHPLLLFDGQTDQLITAVLCPGTVRSSGGMVAVLRRVVRAIRQRWPQVRLALRSDSGAAVLAVYDFCEWLAACAVPRMQLDTLRLLLLSIGNRVWQRRGHVRLRLAASHPGQPLWDQLAAQRRLQE